MTNANLTIGGMHCASCASGIEQGLKSVPGIDKTEVNFAMNSAAVGFQPDVITIDEVLHEIEKLGYRAKPREADDLLDFSEEIGRALKAFIIGISLTIPLVAVNLIYGTHSFSDVSDVWRWGLTPYALVGLLASATLVFAGRGIFTDAWRQTRRFTANMNSLIALGSGAAYFFSLFNLLGFVFHFPTLSSHLYFETATIIITLILLGRYLEARSGGKAKKAIVGLLNLRPQKATAIINNTTVEIESASAQPGMTLLVRPGERIPADGIITSGEPSVDESMLTGESIPQDKSTGETVIGGSLNTSRPFEMEVTASGEDSYLSSIIRIVSEAQNAKAPSQRLADKVAGVFVPITLLIAILTFVGWYFLGSESSLHMLYASPIAVLIIACPCALGLATPTAILAGSGLAARNGIIFRGGDVIEQMISIDAVVFDKTGTVTYGKPEVNSVRFVETSSEEEILAVCASVEFASEHPLAKGIMREVQARDISYEKATEIEALVGFGVQGVLKKIPVCVGNAAVMKLNEISLDELQNGAEAEAERGRTLVYVARGGKALGYISLMDRIRSESAEVISQLKSAGLKTYMFTGDNRRTAKTTAQAIGIDHVESEIRPEQKSELVRALAKTGQRVMMIGDGINDAPALTEATVGVAVGSGADVAKQSADIILVKSNLRYLLAARISARETMRIVKQNLFWALIYNSLAIPIAAGVFFKPFGWSLTPEIGALAMSLSSVIVVLNSTRLGRMQLISKQDASA